MAASGGEVRVAYQTSSHDSERRMEAMSKSSAVPEPSEVPDAVRTYFPETWLFDLHTVRSVAGQLLKDLDVFYLYFYTLV